ncbi:MAG: glycosyltransferase [Candidatus Lokiarchaeota archaeon]|nr:glycosyltransferase [Candidatus Lokiarchaeota archaeon]
MLISVIIITFNEEENLAETIKSVRSAVNLFPKGFSLVEIIVSDGGSTDETINIAKSLADLIIESPKGRHNQLNFGASVSKGEAFLFLHADTYLPEDALIRMIIRLKDPKILGGGFKKHWNWSDQVKRTSFLKFCCKIWQGVGNLLVGATKAFPGDNGIFVRKETFDFLGGYKPLWICEDFDFIYRLKKIGKNHITYIQSPVLTSARRLERYGFFRTIILWTLIFFLWKLGMDPKRLRNLFKKYSIYLRF